MGFGEAEKASRVIQPSTDCTRCVTRSDFETPDYMVSNYETQDFDFGGFEPTPTMSYDCHVNDQR